MKEELKEEAGMSEADKIYGIMLPGSKMAKAVELMQTIVGIKNFEPMLRNEMEKLGLLDHVGELIMRGKEAAGKNKHQWDALREPSSEDGG